MSTVQSLEQERQAILDRMQMRREAYRRMLAEGEDFHTARTDAEMRSTAPRRVDRVDTDTAVYTYRRVPDAFPRTRLMKTVSEHPVLVAMGVAAVLAIGPKRIARSVASGSAALGSMATSQSRMDMVGRALAIASAVMAKRKGG